jgi:hypothetical protein
MKQKIWDLKPDGGGAPIAILMEAVDAREAIARHPERYSDVAPKGTVEFERAEKDRATADALADVRRQENEALSQINAERREAVDAIRKQEREARVAEEERLRAEQEERDGKVRLQNRQGEIDQINQQHLQEETRIRAHFAAKRDQVLKSEPEPEPVVDAV